MAGKRRHGIVVNPDETLFPDEFRKNDDIITLTVNRGPAKKVFSGYIATTLSGYLKPNTIEGRAVIFQAQKEFKNSKEAMVLVQPTGTGKTYVAFHLMNQHLLYCAYEQKRSNIKYNRHGPILFIDWTEALAMQQYEDAKRVFREKTDIRLVTGSMSPEERKRKKVWDCGPDTIIFATPETVMNDYNSGMLDLNMFGFFVFDEIHRSRGNSAYAEICRFARDHDKKRLGLTASICDKDETIAIDEKDSMYYFDQALMNTGISKILYYDERSSEIKEHLHTKEIKIVYCPLSENLVNANTYLASAQKRLANVLFDYGIASPTTKSGNRKDYVTERELQNILEKKDKIVKRLNRSRKLKLTEKEIYNMVSAYRMYRMLINSLQKESITSFLSVMGNYIDYFCISVWNVHSKYCASSKYSEPWISDAKRKLLREAAKTGPEKPKRSKRSKKEIVWLSAEDFKDTLDEIWAQNSSHGDKEKMIMSQGLKALNVVYEKDPIRKYKKFMMLMFHYKISADENGRSKIMIDFSNPIFFEKERYYRPVYELFDQKFLKSIYQIIIARERHPKLNKLLDILKSYDSDTKIIIFSSHVVNVDNIVYLINNHPDMSAIGHRAERFIGHGISGSRGVRKYKGMSKRQQREVIEKFKRGAGKESEFNILVTTSIGEEGHNYSADIAIIVDQTSEARRLIQATGRIGRDKPGVCYILMSTLPVGSSADQIGYWVARRNNKRMKENIDKVKSNENTGRKHKNPEQLSFNF